MELDKKLTSTFAALYSSLSEENAEAMDFVLRVHSDHWPRLEPLTARTVLLKMKERGIWWVNIQRKECDLSSLSFLLDKIGRRDLATQLKDFGQ